MTIYLRSSLGHVQMLTRPLTPMGVSSFRSLIGVSDRYIASLGGYPYINFAVIHQKAFIRKRVLKVMRAAMGKEIINV